MADARALLKKHLPKVQKAVGVRVFCFTAGNADTYTISSAEIRDEMVDILGTGDDNDQPAHVRELDPVLWFELGCAYKPKK
ncbi:MAG: hypothetical protein K8953_05560, partial [Proteobacteria bacterium]|nr:hypothetical protein [Pseudomonadota bacterium]